MIHSRIIGLILLVMLLSEATAVLVHTLDDGVDLSLLAGAPLVLDASYRLTGVPHRVLP